MSNVGDAVFANGKVYVKQEVGQHQKYNWHASDDWSVLKDLKKYKDFDWIVFRGRRRFYTDSQVNELTDRLDNQEQSIRSYQESLKYWGLEDLSADFETLQNYSEGQKETILYYQNLVSEYRDQRDKAMVSRHAAETKSFGLQQRVDELIEQFEHLAVVNKENCQERDAAINQAGVAEQHVTRMIAQVYDLRRKVNEAGATMKLAQSIIDERDQLKQDMNDILTARYAGRTESYVAALDHVIEAVQEIKKDELNDPYNG